MPARDASSLEALQSTVSPIERSLLLQASRAIFGLTSVHLLLVGTWLTYNQSGQAPIFGRDEEISGATLTAWAVLLLSTGLSGLVAVVNGNLRAANCALAFWITLSWLHVYHMIHGALGRWSAEEIAAQLLTDAMSTTFLIYFVRELDTATKYDLTHGDQNDLKLQPLLGSTSTYVPV